MTRRLAALAFVWIFVNATSGVSGDLPTKRRELLTSHLIQDVNSLLRRSHYLQFEALSDTSSRVPVDSTRIRLLGSAAGDLMQWVAVVGRCADCVAYSQIDCDTLTGLRSVFESRMDSVLGNTGESKDSLVSRIALRTFTDSVVAELDKFIIFECSP